MSRRVRWLLLGSLALGGCGAGAASPPRFGELSLPGDARLMPARLRRLTNLELERSWRALTGLDATLASELPPDVRQEGYTPNAAQDVSSAWATRYSALVRELSRRATQARLPALAPCANSGAPTCVAETVRELGLKAYRRPLEPPEQASLEAAFAEGAGEPADFAGGLSLLLRALAESPHFIYVSELGEGGPPGTRARLTDYETASALSFTLRGGPPDAELLDAARRGVLASGEGREAAARRLLGMSDTRYQFRRFALEWLEVDALAQTAKSSALFPTYEALKPFMLEETQSYVDEVLVNGDASVRALLTGGFASVGPELARFYGLSSYGPRASLAKSPRLGVLQQASFLASHAHEDVTSPVKRGDFVMRKLLCEKVKRPAEIGLEVVMPPPSKALTNRERMALHATEPGCSSCHATLDALGFTFEGFDAMGGAQARDRGKPVQTRVSVRLGAGAERELASSAALSRALAETPVVSECFARHAFRYFTAQAEPEVEQSFLRLREQLPLGSRDSLFDALLAYVASDLFVLREVRAE